MTETASVCATMSGPVFDLKPMAAGIISPIIDLRVVDAQGDALPSSQDGEIQLRGVTITPGYWQRDDLTQEAFTPDGWLRTGDLGNIDDDGFLHITGRIKEIVIRGGENIAPIEIENVAYRHPSVKEVAVFGVPDDLMGEELAMVCHPQPGSALTEDELRAHLRNALPSFKVPKYVVMADEPLPVTPARKFTDWRCATASSRTNCHHEARRALDERTPRSDRPRRTRQSGHCRRWRRRTDDRDVESHRLSRTVARRLKSHAPRLRRQRPQDDLLPP